MLGSTGFGLPLIQSLIDEPAQPASASTARRTAVDFEIVRRLMAAPSVELQLALSLAERAQPQSVEFDETFGVVLVVGDRAFLEGHQLLVVERIFALTPDNRDAAFVELEPHLAAHEFLALVDRRLQHLALRREPEAVVDQLGIFRHQLVLEVPRAAVERDALDAAMRRPQDRAARRLV